MDGSLFQDEVPRHPGEAEIPLSVRNGWAGHCAIKAVMRSFGSVCMIHGFVGALRDRPVPCLNAHETDLLLQPYGSWKGCFTGSAADDYPRIARIARIGVLLHQKRCEY
jgi:hypothetical protein